MKLLVTSESQVKHSKRVVDTTIHITPKNYDECRKFSGHYAIIYAVGGGSVVDVAKSIARNGGAPLIVIPTMLSCDAFFTGATAYRSEGTVKYESTKVPDDTLFDDIILEKTSVRNNASGWGDIFSSLIALYTWRNNFKELRTSYVPEIAEEVKKYIEEARKPENTETRYQLFCTLKRSCEIERILGGPFHEESAEHYFLYNLENHWKERYLHGEGVALGILLMSSFIDKQMFDKAVQLMTQVGLHVITPPKEVVKATLEEMKQFTLRHHHGWSIIDSNTFDAKLFDNVIEQTYQAIEKINVS
jgi:glycerol dehydrogenase-like iron-containing ADH family enzyme